MNKERKTTDENLIIIQATREEWKAVQDLITSYRRQCRSQKHHDTMLAHLERFQKRLTREIGEKSPDDYMI